MGQTLCWFRLYDLILGIVVSDIDNYLSFNATIVLIFFSTILDCSNPHLSSPETYVSKDQFNKCIRPNNNRYESGYCCIYERPVVILPHSRTFSGCGTHIVIHLANGRSGWLGGWLGGWWWCTESAGCLMCVQCFFGQPTLIFTPAIYCAG